MSDDIKKETEIAAAVASRAEELKKYAGKFFKRKDGNGDAIQVMSYGGVKMKDGVSAHTFIAETTGMRWSPQATKFLEEHEEIDAPANKTQNKGVI